MTTIASSKIVGGVKKAVHIDDTINEILQVIREVDGVVRTASLTHVDKQTVSGVKYTYHFDVKGFEKIVTVWSKPW